MSGLSTVPRLALAGCGAVGAAFVDLVRAGERRYGIETVLVRDPGRPRACVADGLSFTTNPADLHAAEADVVVEAMGGLDTALDLARATLERGASYVTANKSLVATHGTELAAIGERTGGDLGFDAAVGGGVPVVRSLRETFAGTPVGRISGILNGTANYLLTRVEEGEPWALALASAQAAGYAEADPSRDLDGRDVADKVAVLAWVAWGVPRAGVQISREGLPTDAAERARAAVGRGQRLRLVADLRPDGAGGALGEIRCDEVPADSAFGRTRGAGNTITIETGCGDFTLSGPGAGGPPTALALLADVRAAVARRSSRRPTTHA